MLSLEEVFGNVKAESSNDYFDFGSRLRINFAKNQNNSMLLIGDKNTINPDIFNNLSNLKNKKNVFLFCDKSNINSIKKYFSRVHSYTLRECKICKASESDEWLLNWAAGSASFYTRKNYLDYLHRMAKIIIASFNVVDIKERKDLVSLIFLYLFTSTISVEGCSLFKEKDATSTDVFDGYPDLTVYFAFDKMKRTDLYYFIEKVCELKISDFPDERVSYAKEKIKQYDKKFMFVIKSLVSSFNYNEIDQGEPVYFSDIFETHQSIYLINTSQENKLFLNLFILKLIEQRRVNRSPILMFETMPLIDSLVWESLMHEQTEQKEHGDMKIIGLLSIKDIISMRKKGIYNIDKLGYRFMQISYQFSTYDCSITRDMIYAPGKLPEDEENIKSFLSGSPYMNIWDEKFIGYVNAKTKEIDYVYARDFSSETTNDTYYSHDFDNFVADESYYSKRMKSLPCSEGKYS